jgi:diacylglycerol kinase (ATP)
MTFRYDDYCIELRNSPALTYRNGVLIYNPQAGGMRRHPERLARALAVLRGEGWILNDRPTTGPLTASAFAEAAVAGGADVIVVAGGDGTINEAIAGMKGSTVPLAALPGGTANVLCCELGLRGSMETVARQLPRLTPRRIALGRFVSGQGPRTFAMMAGLGFDAHIVQHINPTLKQRFGKAAYWMAGFRSVLRRLPEFGVKVDGREYRASFALVTRVRNYGGDLEIARSVRLVSPDFEIVLFSGSSAAVYLKYLAGIALNQLKGMSGVQILRGTTVEVMGTGAPVFAQLDGEPAGLIPGRVEIVPDALSLLMPPNYG